MILSEHINTSEFQKKIFLVLNFGPNSSIKEKAS